MLISCSSFDELRLLPLLSTELRWLRTPSMLRRNIFRMLEKRSVFVGCEECELLVTRSSTAASNGGMGDCPSNRELRCSDVREKIVVRVSFEFVRCTVLYV